jgi:GDP-L-fucose synthase
MKKILISGQEGMVGHAIYKLLQNKNFKIIQCKRKDLDFTSQQQVNKWFKKHRPEIVINAAGRVGGILDNANNKADFIYINTMIGFNILNASLKYNVQKLINLGSACIYPKKTAQPIKEKYLLSSKLEPSNEGYSIAKIATIKYCQYIKEFLGEDFTSLQPANLYGERDNYDLKKSHVIPALVRKFHEAKIKNQKSVEVWGSGLVKREFLHVNDLAEAVYFCLKNKMDASYLNIGGLDHVSIKNLAKIIKKIVNYRGKILFNRKYPDGVKNRKLDSSIILKRGWRPKISLKKGLKSYYRYYIKNIFKKI